MSRVTMIFVMSLVTIPKPLEKQDIQVFHGGMGPFPEGKKNDPGIFHEDPQPRRVASKWPMATAAASAASAARGSLRFNRVITIFPT